MLSRRILLVRTLLRLGPRALWLNLKHRLRLKFGVYGKITPACDWRDEVPEFISIFELPSLKTLDPNVVRNLPRDVVPYFSWELRPMPTNWQVNPKTRFDYSDEGRLRHWSEISMSAGGDIKWAWEASRMDWVIHWGRKVVAQPDPDEAELYEKYLWVQIINWKEANPPNQGVNWACGQETSFRMFTLMWVANLLDTPYKEEVLKLLPQHAERIEGAVEYAISQHNNHGLSETVALFLAGHTLPSHPRSKIWREKGKRLFVKQVREQFTRDGWYCQHSHNYTRVALLDALIAMRVARQFEDPLPDDVIDLFRMAAKLLAGICRDGRVPNYGANDGANVLALHGCDYTDFRPIIAATLRSCLNLSPFPPGPWDELSEWFGLSTEGTPPVDKPNVISSQGGGYYALTKGDWLATVRCHTYKDRPAHADMLHVDLWYGDELIFIDGGTYSYNDPEGVGDFLKSSAAHNCAAVNGDSQMVKGSRFLWFDWTKSKVKFLKPDEFEGEHYGYRNRFGVVHSRNVQLVRTEATITDVVSDGGKNSLFQVSWRTPLPIHQIDETSFAVGYYKIEFELPEFSAIEVNQSGNLSAFSEKYGHLDFGHSITITWRGPKTVLKTRIKPLSERESELDPPEPRQYMEEREPWPKTEPGRPTSVGPIQHR